MVVGMVEEIEGRVRRDDSGMEEGQVNAVMAEFIEEVVMATAKCSERTVAEVKCEDAAEIERVPDKRLRWADELDATEEGEERALDFLGGRGQYAVGDVSGKALDTEKVRAARKEEVEFMKAKGIWVEVEAKEARGKTGR